MRLAAALALLLASSGAAHAQPQLLDPTTWFGQQGGTTHVYPLPEVSTSPNAGTTFGLLPVFLFTDSNQQIKEIVAPDASVNTTMGGGGYFRYFSYPSRDTQWYVMGGGAQTIFRQADLMISTGRTRSTWWSFDGRILYEADPTERFFGLGNNSRFRNQSNYTTNQILFDGIFWYNFSRHLQTGYELKPNYLRFSRGAFTSLPYTGKKFPHLKGFNGGSQLLNRIIVRYDTRNNRNIPVTGTLIQLFAGFADRAFLSSVSYTQFGVDVRRYLTFGRFTLAARLYNQYTPAGNETPFWAMPRLGGDASFLGLQQAWRGYGAGRYIDNNLMLINLELRTRVLEASIRGTQGVLELAPLFDLGKVYHSVSDSPFNSMHPVFGLGVRGIAEPFVVGRVDFGYASSGLAIFAGIDYPF